MHRLTQSRSGIILRLNTFYPVRQKSEVDPKTQIQMKMTTHPRSFPHEHLQ